MRVEEVARAILTVEGVQEVHDVHIWSLGGGHNALSLHARIPDMHLDQCERLLRAIQEKQRRNLRLITRPCSLSELDCLRFRDMSCPSL